MKKLLFFVALCLALPLWGQHQRRVLVEEFTQASCGPCAVQNPQFNTVLASKKAIVSPIKYQTSWPGTDPMNGHNASEVANRVTYYGVQGVPNGFVNGTGIVNDCNFYDNAPYCLEESELDAAYINETPVVISIQHNFSPLFDSVFLTVNVTSDVALTGNLKLRVAVTEDEILFDAPPGTNGETEFFQVMKKMFPNGAGTTTGDFAAGETKSYSFKWKMAKIYNINKVNAVAWLQDDDTKEVWQSERTEPVGGLPASSVKAETKFACQAGTSPSFTVTNTGEIEITTLALRYRTAAAQPWTDYTWTGSLAPGASTEIVLTDVVLNTAGSVTLTVENRGANGLPHTNTVAPQSNIVFKVLTAAATTLPAAMAFEGAFPPAGWTVINPSSANGWKAGTVGADGSAKSATANFYDYSAGVAQLVTAKMDLTGSNGTAQLTFDHAYAYYVGNDGSIFFDSLRIDYSVDCGTTWNQIWMNGYETMATADQSAAAFVPTAADWAANSVDITGLPSAGEMLVRFVGLTGFGNNLFIDNINLSTTSGTKDLLKLEAFTIQPNPAVDRAEVKFTLPTSDDLRMHVYAADGMLVQSQELGSLVSGQHSVQIDATRLTNGSYRVVLQGAKGVAQSHLVVLK